MCMIGFGIFIKARHSLTIMPCNVLLNYRIDGSHHVFAVDRCLGADSDSQSGCFYTDFKIVFDTLRHVVKHNNQRNTNINIENTCLQK